MIQNFHQNMWCQILLHWLTHLHVDFVCEALTLNAGVQSYADFLNHLLDTNVSFWIYLHNPHWCWVICAAHSLTTLMCQLENGFTPNPGPGRQIVSPPHIAHK